MANKIQIRRGLKSNLPVLSPGEMGYTTDTKEMFIGDPSGGNTQIPSLSTPVEGVQRQAIINGNFDVAQRGLSFANPVHGQYTLDRYQVRASIVGTLPTSIVHSRLALIPDEISGAFYHYRISPNGAGSGFGVNDYYQFRQSIEQGTRYLCGAGKKVTVSFYARSNISGKKLGLYLAQEYGGGGSPSEAVNGKAFSLTSSWQKYEVSFDTNTLSGKTFGSSNDDVLGVCFVVMWGSAYASRLGESVSETFRGAGNIDIAQIQVNTGGTALPFQHRSFAEEFAFCQRYYQLIKAQYYRTPPSSITSSTEVIASVKLNQSMRVSPSVVFAGVRGVDWMLSDGNGVPNTTGILTLFNYGTEYGVLYFTSGSYTAGAAMIITLMSPSGEIRFDAEL